MIARLRGCLLCFVAGVIAEADADAPLRDVLAAALEANARLARLADELRAENARLREELARRDAELGRVHAELAVLQRMVFGRSSERARPHAPAAGGDGRDRAGGGKNGTAAGPGPGEAAGITRICRRVEVIWDFPGGGYCCPQCGESFTRLGDHVIEQLDWQVTVRVAGALPPPVPADVPVPGAGHGDGARPAEGDRQGPVHERVHRAAAHRAVRGRAQPELAGHRAGPARGGDLPGDLDGGCAAGRGAAGAAGGGNHRPVAGLVAPARRRDILARVRPA